MKKFLVLLCAVGMVFGVVGVARALCIIDFENTPEQYWWDSDPDSENLADFYAGLYFGNETVIIEPDPETSWYPAHSGKDVLGTADPIIQIDFDQPADYVGFYYASWYGLVVTAYGNDDNEIVQENLEAATYEDAMAYWSYDSGSFNIAYLIIQDSTPSHYWAIDDFEYNPAPIPEPATMLLVGTGLIGLAGVGRKKFFKKA